MKTPFFRLSKSVVLEQYKKVEGLCDIVSYSSKTNPDVTKILEKETESMFSVHLVNELKNIEDKSKVIFLAQGWNDELISGLIEKGVRWFVVDNEVDLDTLLKFKTNEKLNVLLRLKLKENTLRTEKYYVFGMTSDVILNRIDEVKEKFEKVGIHFHRKSQNMSEWNLKYELEEIFEESFFEKIDLINIGGGIPSVYANTNVNVFSGIFEKLKGLRSWLNSKNIKMIIEPGRFISAPAVKLVTSIVSIHEDTIIVDASVYNGDLDALVVPVKLMVVGEVGREGKQYVIKGITPCSMDIFRYRCYLPKKKNGDKLVFVNAGAYNFASDFCDQEKLETEVVD